MSKVVRLRQPSIKKSHEKSSEQLHDEIRSRHDSLNPVDLVKYWVDEAVQAYSDRGALLDWIQEHGAGVEDAEHRTRAKLMGTMIEEHDHVEETLVPAMEAIMGATNLTAAKAAAKGALAKYHSGRNPK